MQPNSTEGNDFLRDIWQQFANYDYNASRYRARFTRLQNIILAMGVVAAGLPLLQIALMRNDSPTTSGARVLQIAVVAAPIAASFVVALAEQRDLGQKWVAFRGTAEAIKREIYRYRAGVNQYANAAERDQHLVDAVRTIVKQMPSVVFEGLMEPVKMKGIPAVNPGDDGYRPLSTEEYVRVRLRDQHEYYRDRGPKHANKRQRLTFFILLLGAAGTALGAFGLQLWIPLTASIAAALTGYIGMNQLQAASNSYNRAYTDLELILLQWQATNPGKEWLVQATEEIIQREHASWLQVMLEVVTEVKEKSGASETQH